MNNSRSNTTGLWDRARSGLGSAGLLTLDRTQSRSLGLGGSAGPAGTGIVAGRAAAKSLGVATGSGLAKQRGALALSGSLGRLDAKDTDKMRRRNSPPPYPARSDQIVSSNGSTMSPMSSSSRCRFYDQELGSPKSPSSPTSWPSEPASPTSPQPALYRDLCDDFAGCTISRTEDRGIVLRQLFAIQCHVERRCDHEMWQHSGLRLAPRSVNLHHVVANVVKPATKRRRCSFVELVAKGPQAPLWFVSHWWGEPMYQFIASLQQHSHDRQLRDESAYWVCAYANNQWDLAQENMEDVSNSSFGRAMRRTIGTVSIVDAQAVCYSRIWCCYEVWMVLSSENAKYDMYTFTDEGLAVGITDGYAAVDERRGEEWKDELKYERERKFPFELTKQALGVRLQDAQASREEDRWNILNNIAFGQNCADPPPCEHRRYEQLNGILRGRFAAASWRYALEVGEYISNCAKALAVSGVTLLTLEFGCSNAFTDGAASQLAEGLPASLQKFKLDTSGCRFLTDAGVSILTSAMPRTLKELTWNLTRCEGVTDMSLSTFGAYLPTAELCMLNLRFTSCPKLTDEGISVFAGGISNSSLKEIDLDFSYCYQLDDAASMIADNMPATVTRLGLCFAGCPNITMLRGERSIQCALRPEVIFDFMADVGDDVT